MEEIVCLFALVISIYLHANSFNTFHTFFFLYKSIITEQPPTSSHKKRNTQTYKDSDEANKSKEAKDKAIKPEKEPNPLIKKTNVLPGECLIKQTFDIEKDLKLLQNKYPTQYKPLLSREIISISKTNNSNSIKIMQFKLI